MDGREPVAVLGRPLAGVGPALSVAVPIMRGKTLLGAVIGEFDPTSLLLALNKGSGSNTVADTLLGAEQVEIRADMVVLATAVQGS